MHYYIRRPLGVSSTKFQFFIKLPVFIFLFIDTLRVGLWLSPHPVHLSSSSQQLIRFKFRSTHQKQIPNFFPLTFIELFSVHCVTL